MSCPNCERLRGVLKETKELLLSYSTRNHLELCLLERVENALALPSESGGNCEHFVKPLGTVGYLWMNHTEDCKTKSEVCPFCAPVKKEPEEKSPEEIAEEVFWKYRSTPDDPSQKLYTPNKVLLRLIADAIRSERSTAPKESLREEAIERVVDAVKNWNEKRKLKDRGTPYSMEFHYQEKELAFEIDALEALEKRRKV